LEEQANAVQRMQDYVELHLDRRITLGQLAQAAGYSPWHATRLFREYVGLAPSDYLRARRLSVAAMKLRDTPERVLDVALGAGFDSHDGFTRAFAYRFGLTPNRYRAEAPPLPLFLPRSARGEYMFATEVETNMSESATMVKPVSSPIFVRAVERPRRKFILLRGRQATDYMAYCEEVGCDIWGLLLSIKDALDEPMGVWLPESLRRPGTSVYAQGVEVPLEYAGQTPPDCEVVELPACTYLLFQGQPYQEDEWAQAIGETWKAIEGFKPEPLGYRWAPDDGPRYQLAPMAERGYIEAWPVRRTA
jgi:AraC family transcriptional regulator